MSTTQVDKAEIAGPKYASKFYADTAALGKPLEPTDRNLAETLKNCALRPRPEWFPAIRRALAAEYGITVRVEEIIQQSGGDARLIARAAATLKARSTTELMDDYRETQRIGGDAASEVRRWITAELIDRIGCEAVVAFEARAANEAKEREITAREARKGDIYVTRVDGLYTRQEILGCTIVPSLKLIQFHCADHTRPILPADQRIVVERNDEDERDEPAQRDAEEEDRAALGRAAEEEAHARQAQSWGAEVKDLSGELDDDEQYERVAAGDIQVGDRVARARTHPFVRVAAVRHGSSAVRLLGEHGATIARPQKTAPWWRVAKKPSVA